MSAPATLRVFLVDDEELALKRLSRLLRETGRVEIAGQETDPESALNRLPAERIDALFLDIQMPEMNGFELLTRLSEQPLVVFTTAYDEYALRAFEVNSIDYLLKPVEVPQLERALNKIERVRSTTEQPDFRAVVEQLATAMRAQPRVRPTRIASRLGERVRFLDLAQVTHFFSQDKLTYAATAEGNFVVDRAITELEQELDPDKFIRIHRAILLNADYVDEVHSWFGGRLLVRLRDASRTELTVARDRVRALKESLGF
ncbi:MAG TPA: LytTR family DNA-binding domain-containing protein [Blastocatellia bacterium]|nr:LytTR family DNA-binding domain-containing protein [Blastocatellia bacterium]